MMKDQTGIVQTMPKKELVDFNVAMTAERLMRNGIDPNSLKNANQVENAINQIEAPKKQKTIGEARGIRSTKSAKVFDLEGKEIDPRSKIMGGKQSETEAEIVARLKEENRKTVSKIKARQKMVDDAIDNVSPGFSGDTKIDAELVAEDIAERMGKVYDDLPQEERLDLYDQAYRGLSKQRFQQKETKRLMDDMKDIEDPEDMAQGGRAGFKVGGIDKARRAFLKTLGAVGAGIGALKTGLLGLGKGTTKQVAKEVITTPNAPGKPEWFDALVTRVINEGEDVTKGFATKERELVHTKQINDFAEVTVYRDLDTNTTTVNYGAKLRKDPTKPYERGNISRAVNDPDQIDLVVKGSEDIEPTIIQNEKGFVRRRGTKSSAEFEAYESEPRVVNYDGDMEFDGTNVVNNVDDLMEDVSPLKEYATGKKLTSKEAAKASEKRDKYQKFLEDPVEQANYLESKYGPGPEPDDFASGGIARMLGE
jgi:hypothetical protein